MGKKRRKTKSNPCHPEQREGSLSSAMAQKGVLTRRPSSGEFPDVARIREDCRDPSTTLSPPIADENFAQDDNALGAWTAGVAQDKRQTTNDTWPQNQKPHFWQNRPEMGHECY